MKFYRLFPNDFLQDTMDLTPFEVGLYIRLLNHQYATEKPIANLTEACKVCGIRVEKGAKKVPKVLHRYFQNTEAGWVNPRYEKELNHVQSIGKKRQAAANARYRNPANADSAQCKSTHILDSRLRTESLSLTFSQDTKGLPLHKTPPALLLPPVPAELWDKFDEMRKKIRKPMTAHAANLIVRKLERLQNAGEDVVEVVEQSIRCSWQDVFPVRKDVSGNHEQPSKEQQRLERNQQNIAVALGRGGRLAGAFWPDVSRRNHAATGAALPTDTEKHSSETTAPSVPSRNKEK